VLWGVCRRITESSSKSRIKAWEATSRVELTSLRLFGGGGALRDAETRHEAHRDPWTKGGFVSAVPLVSVASLLYTVIRLLFHDIIIALEPGYWFRRLDDAD